MDLRICIKFCVKKKIKYADAFRMLTVAYGEVTLDRTNVYLWYKMFSEGQEDVNHEERAGGRIGSCHSIFTNDLGMTRVAAKFVQKLLNFDQNVRLSSFESKNQLDCVYKAFT